MPCLLMKAITVKRRKRNDTCNIFGDFRTEMCILLEIRVAEVIFELLTKELLAWVIDSPVGVFLDF